MMGVRFPVRLLFFVMLLATVAVSDGCAGAAGPASLLKRFEYEEEITLSMDGSAIVNVYASVPALVNLRGLDLDIRPNARFPKNAIRDAYTSPATEVVRVTHWRRYGRLFAGIRIRVKDVRQMAQAKPFAWSTYEFGERDGLMVYHQVIGDVVNKKIGEWGLKGDELMGVRLHLPARIRYHNAGKDNLRRGNILVWEQEFAARQTGSPLDIEARMDRQSILFSTLRLFAVSGAIAIAVLIIVITGVVMLGRRRRGKTGA
jgi:hypothetical protein